MIYQSTDTLDDVSGSLFFFVLFDMAHGFKNVCEIISD